MKLLGDGYAYIQLNRSKLPSGCTSLNSHQAFNKSTLFPHILLKLIMIKHLISAYLRRARPLTRRKKGRKSLHLRRGWLVKLKRRMRSLHLRRGDLWNERWGRNLWTSGACGDLRISGRGRLNTHVSHSKCVSSSHRNSPSLCVPPPKFPS